jgi:hypothetical protein
MECEVVEGEVIEKRKRGRPKSRILGTVKKSDLPDSLLGYKIKNGEIVTYTVEQVSDALVTCMGNVHEAAKYLQLSPRTLFDYFTKNPELMEIKEFIYRYSEKSFVDMAEYKLKEKVEAGNLDAIKFTLSRLGGSKWSEKQETTNKTMTLNANIDFSKISVEELANVRNVLSSAIITNQP